MANKLTDKPKNRLAELRGRDELTQTDIAKIVSTKTESVSQKAVSRWESYVSAIPTIAAVRLALHFNVSLDWLLCLTDEETAKPPSKEYKKYIQELKSK